MKNKKTWMLLCIPALLLVMFACILLLGQQGTVTLSEDAISIDMYDTFVLTAKKSNERMNLKWTSSDNSVATVENGVVTAIKEGEVTITVSSGRAKDACTITVVDPQMAGVIWVDQSHVALDLTNSYEVQVKTMWKGEEAEEAIEYTWSLVEGYSEDVSSVKQTKKGAVIKGLEYGNALYTIHTTYRGSVLAKQVQVKVANLDIIYDCPNLNPIEGAYAIDLYLMDYKDCKTSITPEIVVYDKDVLVEDAVLTWTNSDDSVAVMDAKGNIKAKKLGTTMFTGLYQNMELCIVVNVCRVEIALEPIYIETVNNYTITVPELKKKNVQEVLFQGVNVLKSYNKASGRIVLDSEKLPKVESSSIKDQLTIVTDIAQYVSDATLLTMVINNEAELNKLPTVIAANNGAGHYILGNNIKCTGIYPSAPQDKSSSDASAGVTFTGIFDGCGYTIYNMTTSNDGTMRQGLLGYILKGTLKNVSFVNAKHEGKGGFIATTVRGTIENVYIQIDIAQKGEPGGTSTAVLGTYTNYSTKVKNVLIEYMKPLAAEATTGFAVRDMWKGYGSYQGLYVIGAEKISSKVQPATEGQNSEEVYGAYLTYGDYLNAGMDLSEWEGDFWTVTNGIPYPKNLAARKAKTPSVSVPVGVVANSVITIEGITMYDRVVLGSGMAQLGITVSGDKLTIPAKVPVGTKIKLTVQSVFDASKKVTLQTKVMKGTYVTLDGVFNASKYESDSLVVDFGNLKQKIGSSSLITLTVDGENFTSYSYANGVLKLDVSKVEKLGEKTVVATFKASGDELILVTINAGVYTYVINNEAELNKLPTIIAENNGAGHYILGNDIVCSGTYPSAPQHTVGKDTSAGVYFTGIFDGCGYTIYNMTTSNDNNMRQGLLGYFTKGTLKNVSFVNATHKGKGGFIASTMKGTMENVYIQIDVAQNSEAGNNSTAVFGTWDGFGTNVKKVLVEYIPTLATDATSGGIMRDVTIGNGYYQGLYVIGAQKIYSRNEIAGTDGKEDVYGTYMTYGEYLNAGMNLSAWEGDFWTVTNGIPYPKNLAARKAQTPSVSIPESVVADSVVTIEGITTFDRVILGSGMEKLGISVDVDKLTIPAKVPVGTTISLTVQSVFDASKKVTLQTKVMKGTYITLDGVFNASKYESDTLTVDLSSVKDKLTEATLTGVTLDDTAITTASYVNDMLTVDISEAEALGEKTMIATFKTNRDELIVVTINVGVYTYVINNETELNMLPTVIAENSGAGHYILENDIVCSGIYPSATSEVEFTGVFDGCGYTIYNMTTSNDGTNRQGLFGWKARCKGPSQNGIFKNTSFVNAKHEGKGGFIATYLSLNMENVYIQIDISQNGTGWGTASSVLGTDTYWDLKVKNVLVEYINPLPTEATTGYAVYGMNLNQGSYKGLYVIGAERVMSVVAAEGAGDTYGAYMTYGDYLNAGMDLNAWEGDFWTVTNGIPYPKNLAARKAETPNVSVPETAIAGTTVTLTGATIYDQVVLSESAKEIGITASNNQITIPDTVPAGTTIDFTVQSVFDATKTVELTMVVIKQISVTLDGKIDVSQYDADTFTVDLSSVKEQIAGATLTGATVDDTAFTTASYADGVLTLDTDTLSSPGNKTVKAIFMTEDHVAVVVTINITVYTLIINNETELNMLPTVIAENSGAGHYILGNDIECSGTYPSAPRDTSSSDASAGVFFTGIFDGCGYTIYNMTTSNDGTMRQGLLGYFTKGTLKNVSFVNATHKGRGGFIASTMKGTMENVYIQISVAQNNEAGNNSTAVFGTWDGFGTSVKKVLVEYIPTLATDATSGGIMRDVTLGNGYYQGLYVIGAQKIYSRNEIAGTDGKTDVYGAYLTRDAFRAANIDVNAWVGDFWTVVDGIPTPKNLAARITLDGVLNVGKDEAATFTLDLSSIKERIGGATLTEATVDGTAFATMSYADGILTLDSAALSSLGDKTVKATFTTEEDEEIYVTINITVYTMVINNEAELNMLPSVIATNAGAGHYILGNDIVCSGTYPSATSEVEFTGVFDGCGYTIYNMTTSNDGTNRQGLFGWKARGRASSQKGILKNISFVNAKHEGKGGFIATYLGLTIENVYIQIDIAQNGTGYGNASAVLGTDTYWDLRVKNVLVEYINTLPSDATTGYAVYGMHLNQGSYKGLYVIGAEKVMNVVASEGTGDTYGAYKTRDALATNVDLSAWEGDFWTVIDGIPTPNNLVKRITLDGVLNVDKSESETFTVDLSSVKDQIVGATLTKATVDDAAFTTANYADGILTLDTAALSGTGDKTVKAIFTTEDNVSILVTINITVYTMIINNEAELNMLPTVIATNAGAGHYILGNDIVCSGTYPSATSDVRFTGTFDGCGYAIYNMTTSKDDNTRQGLLGSEARGTLKNISFINAKHEGLGGFIATTLGATMENVYIQIDIAQNGVSGKVTTSVLGTWSQWRLKAKKVLVEYITPLSETATTGFVVRDMFEGYGSYQGVYAIGANKISKTVSAATEGQNEPEVYGAYMTRDAFLAANVDVSAWEGDFWTVVDGIPTPKNIQGNN